MKQRTVVVSFTFQVSSVLLLCNWQHSWRKEQATTINNVINMYQVTNHPPYAHIAPYSAMARPPTSDAEVNEEPRNGCLKSSGKHPTDTSIGQKYMRLKFTQNRYSLY